MQFENRRPVIHQYPLRSSVRCLTTLKLVMKYENKRNSPLYKRKNIEYIFTERLKPNIWLGEDSHRILSILGRSMYLHNEDRNTFLLMFGTHYSDALIDSWIVEYGISLGIKKTVFNSLAKKHWHKRLYCKSNYKHKLTTLQNKLLSLPTNSAQYSNVELVISETINSMLEEQHSLVYKDSIYAYRKRASFYLLPEILPNIKGYERLCKYGWFTKSNTGGMTMDHKLSIKYGYDNGIPANILAHPANCEFLSREENSSKNKRCSITYQSLLIEIENWNSQLSTVS